MVDINKIVDEYCVGVIIGYFFVVFFFFLNKVMLEFCIGDDYFYINGDIIFFF